MSGEELPVEWLELPIRDVLQKLSDGNLIHQGWSPQCEKDVASENEWGVLKTTSIQDGFFLEYHNKRLPKHMEPREKLEVLSGDILMTCAGPRVRCGITTLVKKTRKKLIISGKMYRMRANTDVLNPLYLESFLRSPGTRLLIDEMKTGISESGMNITHARFSTLSIPLPPLLEQKRIADKLERVLSRVDAARQRLERVPTLLKRFRASVLEQAVSGELTREWRDGADTDWQEVKLIDLIIEKPRNGYSPQAVEYKTNVKSLSLSATTTGSFDPSKFKYIDIEIQPNSHLWLMPNDILIQRANSLEYVGVSAIFDGLQNEFIYPDLMMKCRAKSSVITKFLYYLLSSEQVRKHFRDNATGTAGNMPKINQQTVIAAPGVLPPLLEQTEIIRRVEHLFKLADQLEGRYLAAKTHLERLTPALLAKAFRGELVEQDPTDEPASVLLERIRAERAAVPAKKSASGPKPRAAKTTETDSSTGEPSKKRGRPAKTAETLPQTSPPQAMPREIPLVPTFEAAVKLLETRKLEREAVGTVQGSLFD
jgi:type I restriction enzyme, S subunit